MRLACAALLFVSVGASAQPLPDGGGAVPPPSCAEINPAGGCCLVDSVSFEMPCPAGYATFDECIDVRGFCAFDPPPDSGVEIDAGHVQDAGFMDAVPTDAGPPSDAGSSDTGGVPDARTLADAPNDRDRGETGQLTTAEPSCGCQIASERSAGGHWAAWGTWAAWGMVALLALRRRPMT